MTLFLRTSYGFTTRDENAVFWGAWEMPEELGRGTRCAFHRECAAEVGEVCSGEVEAASLQCVCSDFLQQEGIEWTSAVEEVLESMVEEGFTLCGEL